MKFDHLFAAAESKHSDRPHETLEPLSNALGIKIQSQFDLSEPQDLADKVRRSYGGETVLICWHHGAIPDLLKAFGAHPKELLPRGKWPDDVFGWLIVLRYDQVGRLSAHVYNESLTPEDPKHPPPSQQGGSIRKIGIRSVLILNGADVCQEELEIALQAVDVIRG